MSHDSNPDRTWGSHRSPEQRTAITGGGLARVLADGRCGYVVLPLPDPVRIRMPAARAIHEATSLMSLPPIGSLIRRPARSEVLAPGHYLTDGVRLFRVVSRFTSHDENASASLEDCYTLEIESYSPDELYSIGLRQVRNPAPSMLETV